MYRQDVIERKKINKKSTTFCNQRDVAQWQMSCYNHLEVLLEQHVEVSYSGVLYHNNIAFKEVILKKKMLN